MGARRGMASEEAGQPAWGLPSLGMRDSLHAPVLLSTVA